MTTDEIKKTSRYLKALANETRLRMVDELLREEKCVTDIQDLLKTRQSNISQHLSILRWAGIVDYRAEGKTRCYYLKYPRTIKELMQLVKKIIVKT